MDFITGYSLIYSSDSENFQEETMVQGLCLWNNEDKTTNFTTKDIIYIELWLSQGLKCCIVYTLIFWRPPSIASLLGN